MQLSAIFRFQVMNADDKNTGDGVTVTKFGNPTFNRVDLPGGGIARKDIRISTCASPDGW